MENQNAEKIQSIYSQLKYLKDQNLQNTSNYSELYHELQKLLVIDHDEIHHKFEEAATKHNESLENGSVVPQKPLLTKEQLFLLKNQVLALKEITSDNRVSIDVLRNLSELDPLTSKHLENFKLEKNTDLEEIKNDRIRGLTDKILQNSLKAGENFKADYLQQLLSKSSVLVGNGVEQRIKEIDLMLQSKYFTTGTEEKLQLEKSFLEVFDIYLNLKHDIFKDVRNYLDSQSYTSINKQYFDRKFFRKPKPTIAQKKIIKLDLGEQMIDEYGNPLQDEDQNSFLASSNPLQIKQIQNQRRIAKHKSFLMLLGEHTQHFLNYHKKHAKRLRKISNNVKLHHEWISKKQKKNDVDNRKRIDALKTNQTDKYRELLMEAKNNRIFEILHETDNYLKEIVSKVVDMKKSDGDMNLQLAEENSEWLKSKTGVTEYDIEKSTMVTQNYQKYYYNLTHTNIEEIREQPSLLEGGTLKNYQLIGLQWMVSLYNNKLNGILADEMGLGKTIQTISLLCYVMEFKQNYGPFLIVVPLATLTNWVKEFEKWAPSIKKVIYTGDATKRKSIAYMMKNGKWNLCITTYEFILRDRNELSRHHWKYIIVDEGHKMKNPKSKFAQTLGQIYKSDYRILLTGTPLQNNLPELWALLNFLLPRVFGSCEDFEKWFKMPLKGIGNEKDVDLNEEEQLLIIRRFHHVLRPFLLRREKKEVEAELPNKQEYVVMVDISAWQKIVYDQIANKECLSIQPTKDGAYNKRVLMNMMMQLRKICDHPYLFIDGGYLIDDIMIRSSGKFELLEKMLIKLVSTGHRMLIFTQMTRLLDILEEFLTYIKIQYLRLDGTTKSEDRASRIDLFNKPNSPYPIFILSTRAGGLGLNLQTADTVILVDSDWNPQMDAQAQDRAHRIGQTREVRVYRLITNTVIEKAILTKASQKKSLDEMVIHSGLFNQKSSEDERKDRIETLIKTQADEEFDEEEITNDEEMNKMLARNDEELVIFNQMDKDRYETDRRIYPHFKENTSYRLLQAHEVPEWVLAEEKDTEKQEPGTGKRVRKRNIRFNIDDELNDDEYFQEFDQDDDFEEPAAGRKKAQPEEFEEEVLVEEDDDEDDDDIEDGIAPLSDRGYSSSSEKQTQNRRQAKGQKVEKAGEFSVSLKLGPGSPLKNIKRKKDEGVFVDSEDEDE